MKELCLNIVYEKPDEDRWIKFDRYPRRLIRKIFNRDPPSGQKMVFEELLRGLDKIKVKYRCNDFNYIKKHSDELVCMISSYSLSRHNWKNPILLGASIFSHALDYPDLLSRFPNVKKILVPGEWMRKMFEPFYGDKVIALPTGIDTNKWCKSDNNKDLDFLIYYKLRWRQNEMEESLVKPITGILKEKGLSYHFIKYGYYTHKELMEKIKKSKAAIFLCEHETQGLAYQQILSTDTPILAWDSEGYWQDPVYYPERVNFKPVSSVPYWDERCGLKFSSADNFLQQLNLFIDKNSAKEFLPRKFILDNLTLEQCALNYVKIASSIEETFVN